MNKFLDKFQGDIVIPLIICEKCEITYESRPDESIDDFESCQYGGMLRYASSKDKYTNYDVDDLEW